MGWWEENVEEIGRTSEPHEHFCPWCNEYQPCEFECDDVHRDKSANDRLFAPSTPCGDYCRNALDVDEHLDEMIDAWNRVVQDRRRAVLDRLRPRRLAGVQERVHEPLYDTLDLNDPNRFAWSWSDSQ